MALRLTALLVSLAVLASSSAAAEEWSRTRISRLPDSAFAVVEISPDGRKVRHLPHHDETGAVDDGLSFLARPLIAEAIRDCRQRIEWPRG